MELVFLWILLSTLTNFYGSASFWPPVFYSTNRDTSTSSNEPSRVTGVKSVLDQATWVTTATGTVNPPYLPPSRSQSSSSPSIISSSTSVSSPASYSSLSRYNPPPPPPSPTTYLSSSGSSYPQNDWRVYNQYPTRNSYGSNPVPDYLNNQQFSADVAIDCRYASIFRPGSSGSYAGPSSSTIALPLPLPPPPPPPSSSSYYPSSTGSSTTGYPHSYGGYRYSGYPCFAPSLVSADYSSPNSYQPLASSSDSSSIWSPPSLFPSLPPPPSSSPIYSMMHTSPSNDELYRKSLHGSGSVHPSSRDHSSNQQSYSPVPKTTRAVAEISGPTGVTGTVVFKQIGNKPISIEGKIMGLASGPHGMHIYEMPFIGGDCISAGDHYNPQKTEHGGKHDWNRHIGDLGNIYADSDGVANFEFTDLLVSLTGGYSIVNRTLGVSEKADDLGRGTDVQSKKDGNAGSPIACGIVHLSPM